VITVLLTGYGPSASAVLSDNLVLTGTQLSAKLRLTELQPNGGNQNCHSTIERKELSYVKGTMPDGINERQSLEYSQWN